MAQFNHSFKIGQKVVQHTRNGQQYKATVSGIDTDSIGIDYDKSEPIARVMKSAAIRERDFASIEITEDVSDEAGKEAFDAQQAEFAKRDGRNMGFEMGDLDI